MDNEPDTTTRAGRTAAPDDFAVVVDARGTVMVWSAGAVRLLGYGPEDVVGEVASGLLAARLPVAMRPCLAAGEQWTSDVALRNRDGDRVTVRLRGTPLADARGRTHWVVTPAAKTYPSGPTDAEAAELWDLTLAQLPLPVAIYDSEARFVTCNQVMTQAMGLKPDEMRGRTLWEIYPAPPLDEIDRLQHQVVRTGEMIFREEQPFRASGEVRDHAWSLFLSPLKNPAGGVLGVSALVIDITEQYWARRRLAVLNDSRHAHRQHARRDPDSRGAGRGRGDGVRRLRHRRPAGVGRPRTRTATDPARHAGRLPPCRATLGAPWVPGIRGPCGRHRRLPSRLTTGPGPDHRPGNPLPRGRPAPACLGDGLPAPRREHTAIQDPFGDDGATARAGVTLGVMNLMRHRTADVFGPDDLVLAEEIAARAAVSIDNARRFTRERRTALTLQRSLLPERLPEVAAVDLAHRYLPAGPGTRSAGTGST